MNASMFSILPLAEAVPMLIETSRFIDAKAESTSLIIELARFLISYSLKSSSAITANSSPPRRATSDSGKLFFIISDVSFKTL